MAVITLAGPKQAAEMTMPDGNTVRVLMVHDGGNTYQVMFDPIEAALIARDLAPAARAAADAVDKALAARGITPGASLDQQRPSGLHVVGDVPARDDDPALD